MSHNVLEVSNVVKKFGEFTAVDEISFVIPEGKIIGFLGPNGAGKTTTIQMLLGALNPTSGSITYFGKDLSTHRQEILEYINFSSTYISMPWRLTIGENLKITSYMYDIKDRAKRVAELLEQFRLKEIQKKQVSELSAGQKTRLMLAKGFINHPKVLLLDEPTASMDPETAQYIRDFIKKYKEDHQLSVLFTSHNMLEVEEICDEVIFLQHGKIIAQDTPYNLAKKINRTHITMLIKDGLKRTISLCETKNLNYSLRNRFIIINIHQNDIPAFLYDLQHAKVMYDEISIDKPDLNDYFLEVARYSA